MARQPPSFPRNSMTKKTSPGRRPSMVKAGRLRWCGTIKSGSQRPLKMASSFTRSVSTPAAVRSCTTRSCSKFPSPSSATRPIAMPRARHSFNRGESMSTSASMERRALIPRPVRSYGNAATLSVKIFVARRRRLSSRRDALRAARGDRAHERARGGGRRRGDRARGGADPPRGGGQGARGEVRDTRVEARPDGLRARPRRSGGGGRGRSPRRLSLGRERAGRRRAGGPPSRRRLSRHAPRADRARGVPGGGAPRALARVRSRAGVRLDGPRLHEPAPPGRRAVAGHAHRARRC